MVSTPFSLSNAQVSKQRFDASRVLNYLLILSVSVSLAVKASGGDFPGRQSDWNGFVRHDFEVAGKPLMVIEPKQAAASRPWVWHGEFFGHKPAPDIELLKRGFHVVYASVPNMLGCPEAVDHWSKVYDYLIKEHQLAEKVGLVGLSRGGLYCYNFAVAYPYRVACIYGDAPVCDFKSWPGGFGKGPGSPNDWKLVLKHWNFKNDEEAKAFTGNPVDNLKPLAQAGIPLLHVFGDADEVVPWEENTGLIQQRYEQLGGRITLIRKPGVKHHPHGLDDPTPIVEFLERHCLSPLVQFKVSNLSSPLVKDKNGFVVHQLESPYQNGITELKVLVPDPQAKPASLRLLLVLPVEKQSESRWGDALLAIRDSGSASLSQLLCVEPSFSALPWYADHPSDAKIRQESHLLEAVLPILRWHYPAARHDRDGRLLVGFSKSGFGAWSMLLRHPDLFGRAGAWDAPLMLDKPNKYGSGAIYGSDENFKGYAIPDLLRSRSAELTQSDAPVRLFHAGFGNFQAEHESIEQLLQSLKIPHSYRAGPQLQHHWSSGWLRAMVDELTAENE